MTAKDLLGVLPNTYTWPAKAEKITGLFCGDEGYQTPKVDTRAAIFRDGKILLVCEKGKWSMPGGWCEFNLSPAENTIKETKEEAGFINEDYIKKLMNYNVHNDIDDILNLNNKINSPNDLLQNNNNTNTAETENKKLYEEEPQKEEKEEEEDEREIYKMFEDKLYKNSLSNKPQIKSEIENQKESKPIQITSIKNQQSRLMSKYFSNALNNNNNNNNFNKKTPLKNINQNNNIKQQKSNIANKSKDNNKEIDDIVNDKIEELNKIIEKLKKDNNKITELKREYDRLQKKFRNEQDEYNKKRQIDLYEFEKIKEEEKKKIEHEKRKIGRASCRERV